MVDMAYSHDEILGSCSRRDKVCVCVCVCVYLHQKDVLIFQSIPYVYKASP